MCPAVNHSPDVGMGTALKSRPILRVIQQFHIIFSQVHIDVGQQVTELLGIACAGDGSRNFRPGCQPGQSHGSWCGAVALGDQFQR